jgi:preprotein translocase subunit YajC
MGFLSFTGAFSPSKTAVIRFKMNIFIRIEYFSQRKQKQKQKQKQKTVKKLNFVKLNFRC